MTIGIPKIMVVLADIYESTLCFHHKLKVDKNYTLIC